MSNFSTPISQIRNGGGGNMNMPAPEQNMPLQMPVYNPNPGDLMQQQPPQQQLSSDMMPPQNMAQSQSSLVDTLLNELEEQPEYQQDMNVAQTQYAMDNVNVPPTRVQGQNLAPENTHSISTNDKSDFINTDNSYMFNEVHMNSNKSIIDKIIDEGKPVLVVFVLFLILSLHQVNRIIFSFVPGLLMENGQLSLYAILLKSLLACILYYGFMKLI